jgi:hypothetical protein
LSTTVDAPWWLRCSAWSTGRCSFNLGGVERDQVLAAG